MAHYEKTKGKMAASVEWFRREIAQTEQLASGRVTPALLGSVRVGTKDAPDHKFRLEEVATVGVKDSNVLVITVYDSRVRHSAALRKWLKDGQIESKKYRSSLI